MRRLRAWLPAAVLALPLVGAWVEPGAWEPWLLLFRGELGLLALLFLGLILLGSWWLPGLWCFAFCPTGAFLDGLTWPRRALLRVLRRGRCAESTPARSPKPHRRVQRSPMLDVVLLLLCLALLGIGASRVFERGEQSQGDQPTSSSLRGFDDALIREAIRRGQLSEHPASYAEPAPGPQGTTPARSSP